MSVLATNATLPQIKELLSDDQATLNGLEIEDTDRSFKKDGVELHVLVMHANALSSMTLEEALVRAGFKYQWL